jgi:pyrimidine operon attenuation protein/uracil phosphoribosyltransferase
VLNELRPEAYFDYGELDVTFHRDDFRRGDSLLVPQSTSIDFLVEERHVLLVDDVLYTGRTVRAAMSALMDFGRAAEIELLVLIDRRRRRNLPVQADYVGMSVDTLPSERIYVELEEEHGKTSVRLASTQNESA